MSRRILEGDITTYKQFLSGTEKSRNTVEKYVRDIKKFFDFISLDSEVTTEIVFAYKRYLMDSYRTSSINSMLAALNSYFDFMGWLDLKIKQVPVQRQMFRSEERELGKNEYIRLLRAAAAKGDDRLYLIMMTICATGIRVSELSYITRESLELGRAEVIGKNKSRVVLVPDSLKQQLLVYVGKRGIKSGSIFVTRTGRPVDRRNIWTGMKGLCEEAGVVYQKIFPHNLRHLFAASYYEKEKDVIKLADILGHANVETTRIYTCTSFRQHQMQIERLGLSGVIRERFIQ